MKEHYSSTCRTCQIVGKPNEVVPPAPLHPIPDFGEPFEHVIVDCVGLLPRSKSGNKFMLTVMCVATCFPEAIPLRRITAPAITWALTNLFTTFGLPEVVQTDQGTNFLSNLFKQTSRSLSISHAVSSAYHPESQGAGPFNSQSICYLHVCHILFLQYNLMAFALRNAPATFQHLMC